MTKRIEIEFKSSVEIMNTPMKKRRFIVDEMIYPGLHVLSGDPKIGKSWMMMDMCLAIAKGEKFLGRKTEQGHVVYMALEDTSDNLQTRMYELTDEPTDNLQYVLLVNTLGNGLEDDLRKCKETFSDLKLIVIDTLQKVRETVDMKYGSDYKDVSTLKSIADELGIAIILVHHNRKQQDSNPNNMILGTNGIPGAADGLLVLTHKSDSKNAVLNISGRGAPSLDINVIRDGAKWKLLDKPPEDKPDNFPSVIHDFMLERKEFRGSASELCELLCKKFPSEEFKNNWMYRELLQHDEEVHSLGISYGKTKSNGTRSICVRYEADRDSSGSKLLYPESGAPAVPETSSNADISSQTVTPSASDVKTIAVPVGDKLIEWAANRITEKLAEQGIEVEPFQP